METRDLRWFQQVADGSTVTELSDLEGTTQPGISRALARLDREVGTPLLHRSGRTLRMTHAGAAFKRHVDALLHELDDGLAAVHQLVDPETGTVTLAFHPSLGTWLVPDLVSSFRADHPDVRFQLLPRSDATIATVGTRSGVDMELSTVRPHTGDAEWRGLLEEPLVLAVPAGHRLARATQADGPIDLAEAADEPFVLLHPGSLLRQTTLDLCTRAGFTAYPAFECEDLATVRAFVAAGLGVAVVPRPAPYAEPPGGPVRHLPLGDRFAVREVGLAWSPERRMLPAARLFHEHMLARAAAGSLTSGYWAETRERS
ncbi:LysR substrate-binding domain-containing protein [Ornithinicoccus hortensis]|uniref:DNA-binding transcriptional LysR family regulator n=1 Tax=Ornithinicoccus hortensis TaxID=82346 RepID=A0A542YLN6_9MICO|nr:LysR substrate-binding domain-containing protein [Ornithinicoccus hortensis]TQL49016.1 DNA-binding transcriptional LysR family regulator [Ornithinicoccus hortensis]